MMTNGELTDEIKRLLDNKTLDDSEAMRLLLVMVSRIQRDVAYMATNNEEIKRRISDIERFNERYPPLIYMWYHNTKKVVIIITIVALIYTLVVSPWMISDIRHALLHMLGLPVDLGIPVP